MPRVRGPRLLVCLMRSVIPAVVSALACKYLARSNHVIKYEVHNDLVNIVNM